MAQMASDGQLAKLIGPANAAADAQGTASGLGIENIRRGVLSVSLTGLGSAITVTHSAGFGVLSTPLSGEMQLTGRPLRIDVAGIGLAGTSGEVRLSVRMRGELLDDTGLPGAYWNSSSAIGPLVGWILVPAPMRGRATIEVVAAATTADGTIYVNGGNRLDLLAVEL